MQMDHFSILAKVLIATGDQRGSMPSLNAVPGARPEC
jgi:hypothetical protein